MEPDPFQKLTDEERLELAVAACRRGSIDRQEAAVSFLRGEYPLAPESMLRALAFHAYFDLPLHAMGLAAQVELSIREKRHRVHMGVTSPLLYNLYNAIQIETVLPEGKQRILDLVKDIEDNLNAQALDLVRKNIEQLKAVLDATEGAPEFG